MKRIRKLLKGILLIAAVLAVLLAAVYLNHRLRLAQERALRAPLGTLVEVDGHHMSVYTEGEGDKTLVFLSGGGTCSPILDFRSLYATLTDRYRIVVVEKFGYGFSDTVDRERDIATILQDTRAALAGAGLRGPYVLCPHSLSGLEALYWAQQYPQEVEAVIGLDMAVPAMYEDYSIQMPMLRLSQLAARLGVTRLLPGIALSDAIQYGTLSDAEKEIYRAVFYDKTATVTMLSEAQAARANAELVQRGGVPQVPMLLFASNGEGTGWDADAWLAYQHSFAAQVADGRLVCLPCPHYVHAHAYQVISAEIRAFLAE